MCFQFLIGLCQIALTEQLHLIDHKINDSWKMNRLQIGRPGRFDFGCTIEIDKSW